MTMTAAGLWFAFPGVDWWEPLPATYPDKMTFACRICIANVGLKADSPHQWATEEEARMHIEAEHGRRPF